MGKKCRVIHSVTMPDLDSKTLTLSSRSLSTFCIRMYMCTVKGMYSSIRRMSATAMENRIRLIGLPRISLWPRTMMFRKLKNVPNTQTMMAR